MISETYRKGRASRVDSPIMRLACVVCAGLLACLVLVTSHVAYADESDGSAFRLGFGLAHATAEKSDAFPLVATGDALQYWDQQSDDANGTEAGNPDAAAGSSNGEQNAEGGESESEVEPTSEVVTAYYHDAWYEAGQTDTEGQVDGSQEAEEDGASLGSEDSEEEGDGEDAQVQAEELDSDLNNLGENNLINLQQTPDNSFMYDASIYDLVNGTEQDQRITVQVKGEVVGDPIRAEQNRGKYWITLDSVEEDKEASISVLVDESVLSQIDTYGGYNKTGTILRVKGLFFIACTSHEGIMDIHAETVTVLSNGSVSEDELDLLKFIPGVGLVFFGIVLTLIYRFLAERQR